MYKLSISPNRVQETLSKHILADGYDLTFDMEKSNGVHIVDGDGESRHTGESNYLRRTCKFCDWCIANPGYRHRRTWCR